MLKSAFERADPEAVAEAMVKLAKSHPKPFDWLALIKWSVARACAALHHASDRLQYGSCHRKDAGAVLLVRELRTLLAKMRVKDSSQTRQLNFVVGVSS